MNRVLRIRHALAFRKLADQHERRLFAAIRKEFSTVAREVARSYPSTGIAISRHRARLEKILKTELSRTVQAGAHHTRNGMGKALGAFEEKARDKNQEKPGTGPVYMTGGGKHPTDRIDKRIASWIKSHTAELIKNVVEVTERVINKVINRGIEEGLGQREIAKEIMSKVPEMTEARADTIARTETTAAMNTGANIEMSTVSEELDLPMDKTWTAVEDSRTRETHIEADGQTVAMNEQFRVGDAMLDFPGDPEAGAPGETINCRCVAIYMPARGVNSRVDRLRTP